MKYSEKWGDSIDGAVELALADLGLSREQVKVTVLEEPSRGFFGIGSKLAKVRVEEIETVKEVPAPVVKEEVKAEKTITKEDGKEILIERTGVETPERKENKGGRNKKKHGKKPANSVKLPVKEYALSEEAGVLAERPEGLVEVEDHAAKKFLTELFEKMGFNVNIKVSVNDECVYVDVDGEDTGTIIGKRGQTLDAIQYLTSLVVKKETKDYVRVIIDAEGYRQKREVTLEKLANRLADKAVSSRRSVRLEPMNPYERKVIHTALQKRPEVRTRSEGEEPYRRVIIEPNK